MKKNSRVLKNLESKVTHPPSLSVFGGPRPRQGMNIPRARKIICGNWKMNTEREEAIKLVEDIENGLPETDAEVVVCPPFIYLEAVKNVIKKIKLGAQDCYFESQGAFTGEVSPTQIKEYCDYVILGHSERRNYQKEDDETIAKKVKASLFAGLTPIVCVGENLEEREKGLSGEIIIQQLKPIFDILSSGELKKIIIAYEPIWALSTTENRKDCNKETADQASKLIRKIIDEKQGQTISGEVRIIYGGNVNPQNAKEYLGSKEYEGVLPGGASLKPDQFLDIIKQSKGV